MGAIDLLASSLNRRDDKANQDLAVEIIKSQKSDWVKELAENLNSRDKNIQSDCIKVLYEIGERGAAELIAPYYKEFGKLLASKNNRLVWGAMTALDTIASVDPKGVYELLSLVVKAIEKGSVITVDHGVGILAKLAAVPKYSRSTFPLLIEQLKRCPAKQLPMYAEKSQVAVTASSKKQFLTLLNRRARELQNASQKKRIEKVVRKINEEA